MKTDFKRKERYASMYTIRIMKNTIKDNLVDLIEQALVLIDPLYFNKDEVYIQKSKRDIQYTIEFTLESIAIRQKNLLINYYAWLIQTLSAYRISREPLYRMFDLLPSLLQPYLSADEYSFLTAISKQEIEDQLRLMDQPQTILSDHARIFLQFLLDKNRQGANQFIQSLIQDNYEIEDIYLDIIQSSMREIGRLWQFRHINVADEHMATVITQFVMAQMYPFIFNTPRNGKKMVALALGDELHEIGIRMVADLFEYRGFETHYLGGNMPIESVIAYLRKHQPDIIALSVTLGNHLSHLTSLIEKIKNDSTLAAIKILIGGQAIALIQHPEQVFKVDGYAANGKEAVKVGELLVRNQRHRAQA